MAKKDNQSGFALKRMERVSFQLIRKMDLGKRKRAFERRVKAILKTLP